MDLYMNSLKLISFLNDLQLSFLHTSIAIVSTLLNCFNYYCLALIILFNINTLFEDCKVVTNITLIILFNINHSLAYS